MKDAWARRPDREEQFFNESLLESCGDCCLALVAIFALMVVHYALDLPLQVSLPLCLQKVAYLCSYGFTWLLIKRRRLPASVAPGVTYYILISVISSVLFTAYLSPGHDPLVFLQVLFIGMSLILLDFRHAIIHYGLVWGCWLYVESLAGHADFTRRLATMLLFNLVALLGLRLRVRVYRKIHWLRQRDEANNRRLQASLCESEEVRANLDTLVLQRTQDLVVSNARSQELQEQLWRSQKLESLGRLAGGIAHDFNNLLTVILTNLQMAQEGAHDPDSRESLRDAETASQRAVELTSHLLAYSRRQVIEKTRVDLVEVLQSLRPLVPPLVGRAIRTEWRVGLQCAPVLADSSQLQQVLMNLVVNARDAMPEGGCLTLELKAAEGGYQLSVTDDGCGIAPEDLQRVMDPFYTTKPVGQGTGLGLSIVQGIVQQFDGRVTIQTEPGQGTSMLVWLPSKISTS